MSKTGPGHKDRLTVQWYNVGIEASLSRNRLFEWDATPLFFAAAHPRRHPSIDVAAGDAAGVWLPLPSSCVPAETAVPSANR